MMEKETANNGDGEAPSETTLSNQFEQVHDEFRKIIDAEETAASTLQDKIHGAIKKLEELTLGVSAVDMFSKNEHFNEINPHQLKFLLLPYMLGSLWQLSTREDRKRICDVSSIYFKDYLKRCKEYGLIAQNDDDVEEEEEEVDESAEPSPRRQPRPPNADATRLRKIQRFKENRELEAKIDAYQKSMLANRVNASITNAEYISEDGDGDVAKKLFISLIKRAINDTDEQMESIQMEIKLIEFRGTQTAEDMDKARSNPPPRDPLKPFIITRTALQKEVYGMGYPSLPVMTVEELYEQRRATGEWGPPPAAGTNQISQQEQANQEDEEAVQRELLQDQDDDSEIARQRQNDEYKDDHRRGWGNRFNRS